MNTSLLPEGTNLLEIVKSALLGPEIVECDVSSFRSVRSLRDQDGSAVVVAVRG